MKMPIPHSYAQLRAEDSEANIFFAWSFNVDSEACDINDKS